MLIYRYDVILKRHDGSRRPNCCIFYDNDKEKAIDKMSEYVRKNGFTITEKDGRFTIGDVLLVKKKLTGEVLSITSYRNIFDVCGKRI